MRNATCTEAESYPMNAGVGSYSYHKNSYLQMMLLIIFEQRIAASFAKETIDKAVATALDISKFSPGQSPLLQIADLGCSVGPNTFTTVQSIVEAIRCKYGASQVPDFLVFFNDHVANDFNTLFTSLSPERNNYVAGVPGSFHGRLFPELSLHFVHSSYALQWLSRVPVELLDEGSLAWNRGRVHYTSARMEVGNAYKSQFAKDMKVFFQARAKEIVSGGLMVLIMLGIQDGIPHSRVLSGVTYDLLGFCLMDMANEGIIRETDVDSFNLPIYAASPLEMTELVNANGCFNIEQIEVSAPRSETEVSVDGLELALHTRATLEGILSKQFGVEIIDQLFDRFLKKTGEFAKRIESSLRQSNQLLVILKRK